MLSEAEIASCLPVFILLFFLRREHLFHLKCPCGNWASQVVLVVKSPPASSGDIRDAGLIPDREDPLGKEMATHSSILAWRIPWTEKPGRLQAMVSQESDMSEVT